jgi:hypothetical protein
VNSCQSFLVLWVAPSTTSLAPRSGFSFARRLRAIVSSLLAIALSVASGKSSAAQFKLYATENRFPAHFYSIDPATGAASAIANTGSYDPGLAFRRSNGLLYGSSDSLDTINVKTGHVTSGPSLPDLMVSIAFSPSDQLYAVNNNGNTLFALNPTTGSTLASVPLTGTTFAGEIGGIDFAPDGTLYGVGAGLYRINPLTGVATRITPLGMDITGSPSIALILQDIDFGPDGVLRGVTYDLSHVNSMLYTINTSTGLGTLVGPEGAFVANLASIPAPEPCSVLLVACGGMSVLASRWRSASCQKTARRVARCRGRCRS